MRLIHRTNYWGTTLTCNNRDDEVDMEAIWVQAVKSCCRGFGTRSVRITMDDLREANSGLWNLFYVSGMEGRNSDRYFHKLVLIPKGTPKFGIHTCVRQHKWIHKGEWDASKSDKQASQEFRDLIHEYTKHEGYVVSHIHIGIRMDSCPAGKGNSY